VIGEPHRGGFVWAIYLLVALPDLAVSTGSASIPWRREDHVWKPIGLPAELVHIGRHASGWGRFTDEEEVDYAGRVREALRRLAIADSGV